MNVHKRGNGTIQGRRRDVDRTARGMDLPPTRVVVDACVWHASFLRDLLVHAAVMDAIEPLWTPAIETEWTRSVLRRRPEIPAARIQSVADRMRAAIPGGCVVTPSAPQIPRPLRARLPDPSDLHVVEAAVATKSTHICTFDRAGFPSDVLRALGIEAVTPDRLLRLVLVRHRRQLLDAMHRHRTSLRSPPADVPAYREMLERNTLAETARVVERELEMRTRRT